ncbi:hypothetical protein CMO91_03030 [Candidatus Woesearchaeota archaeon]|nr:hypothetical protein [Candidatus Woesearchaeota archaeon]|tara:strand:+ start:1348 stop:1740 length:393 start_codon:yes stop_codon:yes gene_type:complete
MAKTLIIQVRSIWESFKEFRHEYENAKKGKMKGGYYLTFANMALFRKTITPKRLELVHVIASKKPSSVRQLAALVSRDYKSVSQDLAILEDNGLVTFSSHKGRKIPQAAYDNLHIKIPLVATQRVNNPPP